MLHNLASGRAYRFTPRYHQFIALLDGKRTVEEVWQSSATVLAAEALNQDEVMDILARLYLADVLQSDQTGDAFEIFERRRRQRSSQRLQQAKSPLAIRIPLFDPDALLERLLPFAARAFSVSGLFAWLALVLCGAVTTFINWNSIAHGDIPQLLSPSNLLILGLCYPMIKAFHELGHGLATKVWGGEVHQAGVMLVAFMPMPYVDASASNTFPEARRRVVVSAAGIIVELAIATLALFIWLAIEPGLLRDIAYNLMLIGSVSTLLFNGNPLLRFDGYYIFIDAFDLPNLATRANKYLGYLVKRYALGVTRITAPVTHSSEPRWLFTYGVLAFVYRIAIVFAIALFVAEAFPTVGVVLALWSVISQIAWPLLKNTTKVLTDPELQRQRMRALSVATGAAAATVAVLFVLPAPLATNTEGVVAPAADAEVRAGRSGIVARFVAAPDEHVQSGQTLISLVDPFLDTEIAQLDARFRALTARRKTLLSERKMVEVALLDEEVSVVGDDLARAREKRAALQIPSPATGVFLIAQTDDLIGRYVEQGDLLGYVADLEQPSVRVVIAQADIGLVRTHTEGVSVRLAEQPAEAIEARIALQVPGAIEQLPSAALGARGGGPFAIAPDDETGTRPIDKVFEFELTLPHPVARLGGRAYVRFDHGREPIGQQWYRRLRQLFLSRFNV